MSISVCLHILFLFLLLLLLPKASPLSPEPPPSQSVTVTLMQPTPQPRTPNPTLNNKYARPYIDTSDLKQTTKSDPNALFEGASNTQAASKNAGTGDVNLPSQQGQDKDDFQIKNSSYSPSRPGENAPSPTPEKDQKQQPATPPTPPSPPTVAQKKSPASPQDLLLKPGDVFTQNPPSEESPANPSTETIPQPPSPPATAARPPPGSLPSAFSIDRQRSTIDGGAPSGDDSSVATQESEIGRYKAKLYRAVGSRWYIHVQQFISTLSVDKIRIRFYVRSDGRIKKLEVTEGNPQSALAGISIRSIKEIDGQLEPFSDSMKQQLGDGYWEEISFSVY